MSNIEGPLVQQPGEQWAPPSMVYSLTLVTITSVLLISFRRRKSMRGTPQELEAFYNRILTRNLALGWWSIFGIIWTPMSLSQNSKARAKLRNLVTTGAKPDWYKDPSGRHGSRYWDGARWTDQVRDVEASTDPVA